MDTAQISTFISLGAFAVAAYGIAERRISSIRSERIRLTTIVENLSRTRYELTQLASQGTIIGNNIEAIHARLELLSQQAVSLVWVNGMKITSAECRELAYCLEEVGYREDAEDIWDVACKNAEKEGETQLLHAHRGYAYFLFRALRPAEARELLQGALSRHPTDNDPERLVHAETLHAWAVWEIETQGPQAPIVAELSRKIDDLSRECISPRGKAMVTAWVIHVSNGENTNIGEGTQHSAADQSLSSGPPVLPELPAPANKRMQSARPRRRSTRRSRRR